MTMLSALAAALVAAPATISSLPDLRSDQAVISYTDRVIAANYLSTKMGCLQYSAGRPKKGILLIDVFEIHSRKCGGDAGTAPLLFSIKYDLRRNVISSDEGSGEFTYHRIHTP